MSATLDKATFLKNYTMLVAHTWSDDGFKAQVLKDPKTALTEAGIAIKPEAKIKVIEWPVSTEAASAASDGADSNIDRQYDLWVAGNNTGTYELRLPMRPEDFALSDGALNDVQGGGINVCACCCCCPCCCCT